MKNKKPLGLNPNSIVIKEYKKNQKSLTYSQFEIGIGLILGDASLQTQNKGKSYRLKFEYKNINYIKDISPPHKKTRINSNGNKVITWGIQTLSHPSFNCFADIFIKDNKKSIPKGLIEKHQTPIGLTYWFMDDGGKQDYTNRSKGIVFNTHSFTNSEVNNLAIGQNDKFKLKTWTKINKNKSVIVISSKSFNSFYKLINPYIINSMRYKLDFNKK